MKNFKKLMRRQVQETLDSFADAAKRPLPKKGWIRTIRESLGISSSILAQIIGCSRVNITALENREKKKTISLKMLEKIASAMNCKLVYGLVPLESLDTTIANQAKIVAKKKIARINHSMKLEQQGLTNKQIKQQEENLIQELLEGNIKDLWRK